MKKIAKIMLPIFLCIAIACGGAYTLLVAETPKITNTFSFAYTDIEVQEPSWEPSKVKFFKPGQVINKDPLVYNSGGQEAYVYMSVFTPNNLFSYDINTYDWSFVTEHDDSIEVKGETYIGKTAYYSYKLPVKPGEKTSPLFEKVTVAAYDVDYENYLEDEKSAGRGNGSSITGHTQPIIVNAFAVTTDIDDDMLKASVTDTDSLAYNYGRMRAWEYLRRQTEASSDTHRCINAKLKETVRVVEMYDLANNKLGEVSIASCENEVLNVDFVNNYLSKFGKEYYEANNVNIPLYLDENEMYYFINFTGNSDISSDTPVDSAGDFRLNVNLQYAVVYLSVVQNGTELGTLTLLFENGTSITAESIQEKIQSEYGIGITINETIDAVASHENRYNITAEIVEQQY